MRIDMIVFLITILCSLTALGQDNKWESILPLHSTRSDVEAILGRSSGECNCVYETTSDRIEVRYAERTCSAGWNVPNSTVIEFVVEPKLKLSITNVEYDLTTFVKVVDDSTYSTYLDVNKGVTINASPYGEVERIKFGPTSVKGNDCKLRCPGAPPYAPFNDLYSPAASFRILGWKSDLSKINDLLARFSSANDHKLYIIVYFGPGKHKLSQAQYIERLRTHLREYLPARAMQIYIIAGGDKHESEVDAFILRSDLPPPVPTPMKIS